MRRRSLRDELTALFLTLLSFSVVLVAEARTVEPTRPVIRGFRGEFLKELDGLEKKIVGLAKATPEKKYAWRPAPGIRSIGEVYVHIASTNFFLASQLGVKMPEAVSRSMDATITDKGRILALVQHSFEQIRGAVLNLRDVDLERRLRVFSQEFSGRSLLLLISNHMHEHLGQSIAYARMNGVVPPWSSAD